MLHENYKIFQAAIGNGEQVEEQKGDEVQDYSKMMEVDDEVLKDIKSGGSKYHLSKPVLKKIIFLIPSLTSGIDFSLESGKKKSRKQKCLERLQKFKDVEEEMSDDDKEEEKDEDMNDEDETDTDSLSEFKQKLVSILEESKLEKKRSAKMDTTDFLQLLSVFNAGGIHFK